MLGCTNAEVKAVRGMPINHVDLSKVKDGEYLGAYAYGGFSYEVKVTVANHQIKDIAIIKNRTTKHARMAEGVVLVSPVASRGLGELKSRDRGHVVAVLPHLCIDGTGSIRPACV
jgi:hypothetical protein